MRQWRNMEQTIACEASPRRHRHSRQKRGMDFRIWVDTQAECLIHHLNHSECHTSDDVVGLVS